MKKLLSLALVALIAASCAGTQTVTLQTTEFTVPKTAKFSVFFFKTKGKGFDVALNGTSLTGNSLVIRKDEVSCGRGTTVGVIRGMAKVGDQYIMLPGESYKEFQVYCGNSEILKAEGEYYVKIKNIYSANIAGQPEKIIASDVRLELK